MSKEQTPITAKEFIPKNKSGLYSRNAVETLAEQYAQAKVLEALEREVIKAYEKGGNFDSFRKIGLIVNGAKEYYETEVKPKYK